MASRESEEYGVSLSRQSGSLCNVSEGVESTELLEDVVNVLDRSLLGDEEGSGIANVVDRGLHDLVIALNQLGLGNEPDGDGAIKYVADAVSNAGERIGSGLDNLAAAIREHKK
jgi:hypothetical protein